MFQELNQSSVQPAAQTTGQITDALTEREIEVLRALAHGLSNQEIVEELVISERTVRTHVSNILDQLQLANRTQSALYALRHGIAELDSE